MSLMDSPLYQFVMKSFLAGVLIGFGCVIYVASPVKYVGSFLFSLGLLTIIIKQFYLYTGKVGDWVPSTTFRLIAMFIINGIGCALTAYLFTLTRIDLSAIQHITDTKLNDTMYSSFILAIGCGAMMHIAYYNFTREKHPLYVIMPIMFFMLAGFEHCVANCGFFAMAKIDMTTEDWTRLALIVLGNGVGSWIFTKLMPKEKSHGTNHSQGHELSYCGKSQGLNNNDKNTRI